jgi:hypothetical protein
LAWGTADQNLGLPRSEKSAHVSRFEFRYITADEGRAVVGFERMATGFVGVEAANDLKSFLFEAMRKTARPAKQVNNGGDGSGRVRSALRRSYGFCS